MIPLDTEAVVREACRYYGICEDDLSRGRGNADHRKKIIGARTTAAYLIWFRNGEPQRVIAERVGWMSHRSVVDAIRVVKAGNGYAEPLATIERRARGGDG